MASDEQTGVPLGGASVSMAGTGSSTTTDSLGRFAFKHVDLPEAITTTTLLIQAEGYGAWTIRDVPLINADVLYLDAKLGVAPVTITVPDMTIRDRAPSGAPFPTTAPGVPTIDQSHEPLPETIRVRITGDVGTCNQSAPYTVEIVEFRDYVKHVLPYEWLLGWPRESLRAGAMAVKMYAWQIVANGGRYPDADVYDSVCDQVYIPGVTYQSTNRAIDFTWNWRLIHADLSLFRTHYLDHYWRCEDYGWQGYCMGQWDTYYHATGNNGHAKLTWDEMLFEYYLNSQLSYVPDLAPAGFLLHFFGNGWGDYDRVKILIDDPDTGGLPADIGAADFTIEWWMRAELAQNNTPNCSPGSDHWKDGNALLDRDVMGAGDFGEYGASLAGGKIAFGIDNGTESETLCGVTDVADGLWHHIALTRRLSDGEMKIFVDGDIDATILGPSGDISYRDGRSTSDPDQDPYLVIGARKADVGPAFNGDLDEIRLSNTLRYTEAFLRPDLIFSADTDTVGLYHFDDGFGNTVEDSASGLSPGVRMYGGDPDNGPEWAESDLFLFDHVFIPVVIR